MEGNFRWEQVTVGVQPRIRDDELQQGVEFAPSDVYGVREVPANAERNIGADNNNRQADNGGTVDAGRVMLLREKERRGAYGEGGAGPKLGPTGRHGSVDMSECEELLRDV